MKFPHLETELKHSPERVRKALMEKELEPYFKKSGLLTRGSVARHIRWQVESDGSLLGKLSYWRSKNLCVFRFRVQLEQSGTGTKAVLLAQHGPFSPFLRFLLYLIGICIFVVGVVFSLMVDKAIQYSLQRVVENLERLLKMWDESA